MIQFHRHVLLKASSSKMGIRYDFYVLRVKESDANFTLVVNQPWMGLNLGLI